jgi:hypothetical protein
MCLDTWQLLQLVVWQVNHAGTMQVQPTSSQITKPQLESKLRIYPAR